jgi:hypothetical protein
VSTNDLMTIGQAAVELGVIEWKLRRVFKDGQLPEPPRVGVSRVIRRSDLPKIKKAIEARWPAGVVSA